MVNYYATIANYVVEYLNDTKISIFYEEKKTVY